MKTRVTLMALVIAVVPLMAYGVPIAVTGSDLIGSRDTANGLVGQGRWAPSEGGVKITWEISYNGTCWDYHYAISNADGSELGPELSHTLFEISPTITPYNIDNIIFNTSTDYERDENGYAQLVWGADPNGTTGSSPGGNNGNPNLPADLYGVKFGDANILSFQSTRKPVWGDIYAKDGTAGTPPPPEVGYATTFWNAGIGTDPLETDAPFINWIPTVDTDGGGGEEIPEPATIALLGLGMLAVTGLRRLRRRR